MEVSYPSAYRRVNLIHDPVKGHDRPFSLGEIGDPVFDRLQGFLRWLNMRVIVSRLSASSHSDCKSQKVKLPFVDVDGLRLGLVQGKPHPFQYSPQHGHGFVRFLSA